MVECLPAGATLKVGAPLKDINLCRGSIAKVSERYAVSESSEHKREATIFVDFLLNQAEGVVALAEEGTIPLSRAAREYYQEQGLAEEAAMQTKEQLLNSVMLTRDAELEGLCDGELPAAYSRVVSGLSYGEYNAREAAQLLMDEL